MDKKAGVFKVIFMIFIIIILLILAAGFYFYQFHVFKTVRICVSEEVQDIEISCESDEECLNSFLQSVPSMQETMDNAPKMMSDKLKEVLDEAIFCETTCKVKSIYGEGFGSVGESVDSCKPGEIEITQKIRGKEGIELLKFAREQGALWLIFG